MPDIDIDFSDRDRALKLFRHIPASIKDKDQNFKKHNTGIYFQSIPFNPLTDSSSLDYKEAEERGYFKIDFLNVGIYKDIRDEAHLKSLMEAEPLWDLLLDKQFVSLLFHLKDHSEILKKTCPTSVEQLAAVLAMIRPAKRYLIGKNWTEIMKEVWVKPEGDEYYFKKSHAVSYAMAVIVQMNLICDQISYGYS